MQETIGGGGNIITKGFPTAWGLVAKPCDYCNSAAALLFCRTDSAFMCMACESKVHSTTTKYKHERVWMCEVCEQAPASVTCKADAALLCVTCDRDIHSANPLSRRHERIPVVPFYDTAELVVKSPAAAASTFLVPPPVSSSARIAQEICLIDPTVSNKAPHADAPDLKSMEFPFAADSDNYLDFDYPISTETQHYSCGTDGVVPDQVQTFKTRVSTQLPVHSSFQKHFEIDFTKSHISSYNNSYTAPQSLSHSVSSSSLDVGVVPDPDGSCMTDISYQFGQSMSSSDTVDLTGSTVRNQASQMILGLNREARVLRYREKRKNRKFEKTIRYASRKAYAETRPRIKGRFAKRTNNDQPQSDHHIMDGMFGLRTPDFATDFISESKFGVIPSF